jgi:hypothetical protein
MALAYRSGVPRNPSRSTSSPMHSSMVFTAPSSLINLSSACLGVASSLSLVPRPAESLFSIVIARGAFNYPLGQLNPSKSIGGLRVYGLADRPTSWWNLLAWSSLGSLAASALCEEWISRESGLRGL